MVGPCAVFSVRRMLDAVRFTINEALASVWLRRWTKNGEDN
jgi:hypothetical protein